MEEFRQMIIVRPSAERIRETTEEYDAQYSFSVAKFVDKDWNGFRHLVRLHQVQINPGVIFSKHMHYDLDAVSYVLEGQLQHSDDLGNKQIIDSSMVQCMNAGTGILHTEGNPSTVEKVSYIQMYFDSSRKNNGLIKSSSSHGAAYSFSVFDREKRLNKLVLLASGREKVEGALKLNYDVDLYVGIFSVGAAVPLEAAKKHLWVQVIKGNVKLGDGPILSEGDGAGLSEESREITVSSDTEALFIAMT